MALDDLIPGSADDEGATGIDRSKKSVAVFEAALEVLEGLMQLIQEPFQLSSLDGGGCQWSGARELGQEHPAITNWLKHWDVLVPFPSVAELRVKVVIISNLLVSARQLL